MFFPGVGKPNVLGDWLHVYSQVGRGAWFNSPLVLKGIYHYWTYCVFFSGVEKRNVLGDWFFMLYMFIAR